MSHISDVIQFLLRNPDELERVRQAMRRFNAPEPPVFTPQARMTMVACSMYGCQNLKPEGHVMCDSCGAEYREDPDAFK